MMRIAPARPWVHRVLRATGYLSVAAVLTLFVLGVLMLATVVRSGYVAVGVLVLALLPVIVYRFIHVTFVHLVVLVPLLVMVPILGLLAFDVIWAAIGLGRPRPDVGLAIAGVVVGAVAYLYMRWLGDAVPEHPGAWALFGVLAALILCALVRERVPELSLWIVAFCTCAAVWFYLHSVAGPRISHPIWWAALLVAFAVVIVPLVGEAVQGHRSNVILLVLSVAAGVAGLAFLGRHRRRHPGERFVYVGGGFLVAGLALLGFSILTVVLGSSPTVQARPLPVAEPAVTLPDAAFEHSPVLLFDSGEQLHTPLNVDSVFARGLVELCPEGRGLLAGCTQLHSANDLRNGIGNMRFNTQELEGADIATTIYVHVTTDPTDPSLQDLDYWWYLPDNPADTARGAMCGAGLVIPEITCFDHQSDWEGVVVVVNKVSGEPAAVEFAAHSHVVYASWALLQSADGKPPRAKFPSTSRPRSTRLCSSPAAPMPRTRSPATRTSATPAWRSKTTSTTAGRSGNAAGRA